MQIAVSSIQREKGETANCKFPNPALFIFCLQIAMQKCFVCMQKYNKKNPQRFANHEFFPFFTCARVLS